MYHLVMIDWGGPSLTGEQALVLRNIASLWLRGSYGKEVNFTHFLIEGKLRHRGRLSLGSFSGSRFFADFGSHNNAPWYSEFMLPAQYETAEVHNDDALAYIRIVNEESLEITSIDVPQSQATADNIL
jgi:hypothetical protein